MKRYSTFSGEVFEAAIIKAFDFDSELSERYLILDDGLKVLRPKVHGFQPQIGDYFVQGLPRIIHQKKGPDYVEPGQTHIVGRRVFAQYYKPLPETRESGTIEECQKVSTKDTILSAPIVEKLIPQSSTPIVLESAKTALVEEQVQDNAGTESSIALAISDENMAGPPQDTKLN